MQEYRDIHLKKTNESTTTSSKLTANTFESVEDLSKQLFKEEKRKLKKIINDIYYENKIAAKFLSSQLESILKEEKKLGNKICHSGERLQLAARLAEAAEKSLQDIFIELQKQSSNTQNVPIKKKNEPQVGLNALYGMIAVFVGLTMIGAPTILSMVVGLGILGFASFSPNLKNKHQKENKTKDLTFNGEKKSFLQDQEDKVPWPIVKNNASHQMSSSYKFNRQKKKDNQHVLLKDKSPISKASTTEACSTYAAS